MPKTVSFDVHGLRQLGESMRALSTQVRTRIGHGMTSAGAKVIREAGREAAPVGKTGQLKANLVMKRARPNESPYTSQYVVGVRKIKIKFVDSARNRRKNRVGKKYTKDIAFYWRFVEFGTVKMPAVNGGRGFLRPALSQHTGQVIEAMRKTGARRIMAAAKKASKATP